MYIDDMDKFEEKEMKKIRLIKSTWYDWLMNYISELIRENVGCFKTNNLKKTNLIVLEILLY